MILNVKNGKIYVGKSNSDRRWKQHKNIAKAGPKVYKSSFSLIHKSIRKYGEHNFEFITLQYVTDSDATMAEKYWIEFYKTNVWKYGNNFGYNLTEGGEGWLGHHHTNETKNRLRKIRLGRKHSAQTIYQMSIDRKGVGRGSSNSRSKLTEEMVMIIKQKIRDNFGNRVIAKEFGVHHATISSIRIGKLWSHIK